MKGCSLKELSLAVEKKIKPARVQIRIKDTGKGISQKDINEIFDPYFTTKKTGTGLGLTVVRNIVKEHKGSLKVIRSMDKGAEFVITLESIP